MDVRFKGLTLHEALALLEEEEDDVVPQRIYVEPPAAAVVSDEDSGGEDEGGLINNLTGRQLNAPCEIVLSVASVLPSLPVRRSGRQKKQSSDPVTATCPTEELSSDESETEEPSTSKPKKVGHWVKEDLRSSELLFPEGDFSAFTELSPVQMFEKFVDDSIIETLVRESRNYACFLNCPDPQITQDEMKAFLGILILSGYACLPSKRSYWDQGDDMRNTLVYNSMRRDRFLLINRFLHFNDNSKLDATGKMWKLRPLMNQLKENFKKHYVPSRALNFDESMIEYYGRHGCKQFIRGKPIRFGFKNWCLNSPNGYLLDFEVYQGKAVDANTDYDKQFGKCASPLVVMLDNLPVPVRDLPLSLYFDNLFTSLPLLAHLGERGYQATGTMRENRLPANLPLDDKTDMMKSQRGTYCFAKSKEDDIIAVRWRDNAVVTALSTAHGVQPVSKVSRYSKSEKKKIQVDQPAIIREYNKHMGGTDLMDQHVNIYRIGIRGKKWWWCIFTYLIDVSIVNAWVTSRSAGSNLSQLDFRRAIVQTYLRRSQHAPKSGGRPVMSKSSRKGNRVSHDIRYDGRNHLLAPCGSRLKCALETCSSQTRLSCTKCDVGLCADCNVSFHIRV